MTSRRETNHNSHSNSPRIFVFGASRDATIRDTVAPLNFRDADKNSSPRRIVFHFGNLWQTSQQFQTSCSSFLQSAVSQIGTARPRFANASQVQSTSTSASPALNRVGAFQCTEHCRGAWITRAKSSDQMVGLPTQWSKPYSPISPTRFGLKTLRLRSQRFAAAAFVPLNAISAANENGPAMRSRSSLLKSSGGTPCGTSRSFPNGSRRPF
jgi:hypothetical protein